jgi:hypothetical protein
MNSSENMNSHNPPKYIGIYLYNVTATNSAYLLVPTYIMAYGYCDIVWLHSILSLNG